MLDDFFIIFFWWFLILGLGVIVFPLILLLFKNFFDRGYAVAKIAGILFISYLIWLLGSLKILPFSTGSAWLIIILLGTTSLWYAKRQGFNLPKIIRENWRVFVFEEILFFVALVSWSFVRGYQPNIQGLEKFMDYGFVNSILRSKYFPPADMWLTPKTINYYYFGHLITAVLTKISGIDSAITYNLMIATILALSFTAAFSLGGNLIFTTLHKKTGRLLKAKSHLLLDKNLKPVIIAGLISATLLTLGGNLHPLYWFATHGNFKNYWYPDATRFIVEKFGAGDNTIHEFPIYSFVVADLHGHLLNLPLVLLFLSLVLALFLQKKISLPLCLFASFLLGVFYMTNAWDLPIYFLFFSAAMFLFNYLNHGLKVKTFFKTFSMVGYCVFFAVLFSLPFHLNFKSIAQGIESVDFHSPLWMLPVLWGFPLIITLSFVLFFFFKYRLPGHREPLLQKIRKLFTKQDFSKETAINYFIFIFLSIAWFLIIIPEIFYLKDIYIHSHQRANTMFKLTYQSFVMFSIAAGYIVVKISTSLKKGLLKFLLVACYLLLVTFIFIYPYFATRSYYGLKTYYGLYGLDYLQKLYPDDYKAIVWLKENVAGQPIIVEAVGESYTDFARVSANTGLPTLLGWRVHEWLWRGSFDEPGKRTDEVKTIYESPDLEKTKQLLSTHRARLVFIGTLERQQYQNLQEEKFGQLGEVVFSSGETKIYQFNFGLNL